MPKKVGTGFTDQDLIDVSEGLLGDGKSAALTTAPEEYDVPKTLLTQSRKPDVWFAPASTEVRLVPMWRACDCLLLPKCDHFGARGTQCAGMGGHWHAADGVQDTQRWCSHCLRRGRERTRRKRPLSSLCAEAPRQKRSAIPCE